MASLARSIPHQLTSRLSGCDESQSRLCPPANEEQMAERLARAAEFLKRNPIPLVANFDGPEVSGGEV